MYEFQIKLTGQNLMVNKMKLIFLVTFSLIIAMFNMISGAIDPIQKLEKIGWLNGTFLLTL